MKLVCAAATLLLSMMASSAGAESVYRCGNAYSATPCPDAKLVDATDPRSAAQRAEGLRVAADERQLANEMRRARLAEQAAWKPAAATSLSGPPPAPAIPAVRHPHAKKRHAASKPAATSDFVAIDPTSLKRRGQNK